MLILYINYEKGLSHVWDSPFFMRDLLAGKGLRKGNT